MLNPLNWTGPRSRSTGEFHPIKLPQIDDDYPRIWGFMPPFGSPRNVEDRMSVMIETVRHLDRCILISTNLVPPDRNGVSACLVHVANGVIRPDVIALDSRHTKNLEKMFRWFDGSDLRVAAVQVTTECPPLYGTQRMGQTLVRSMRMRDAARVGALAKVSKVISCAEVTWI